MFFVEDVDFVVIVCGILGFVGVDFVNFVNEVVLIVVCCNFKVVDMVLFEYVKDKVFMGVECKMMMLMDNEKEVMVYYEVGYVVVVVFVDEVDLLYKIMIILCGCVFGLMM